MGEAEVLVRARKQICEEAKSDYAAVMDFLVITSIAIIVAEMKCRDCSARTVAQFNKRMIDILTSEPMKDVFAKNERERE
jgi:hypothetical protein